MVEIKEEMGSFHIIDGEKVSVRYRNQKKTCAKCHLTEDTCPGKAMARNCTNDHVKLSDHMKSHWEKIKFVPDPAEMNEVDETEECLEIQVGQTARVEKQQQLRDD